jgi:hypothetical protein
VGHSISWGILPQTPVFSLRSARCRGYGSITVHDASQALSYHYLHIFARSSTIRNPRNAFVCSLSFVAHGKMKNGRAKRARGVWKGSSYALLLGGPLPRPPVARFTPALERWIWGHSLGKKAIRAFVCFLPEGPSPSCLNSVPNLEYLVSWYRPQAPL